MVKHVGANRVLIAIWDSGAEGDRYRDQGVVGLLRDETRERLTEGLPFDAVHCHRNIAAMLRAMAGEFGANQNICAGCQLSFQLSLALKPSKDSK